MSHRFRICLVLWITVIALSVMTGNVHAQSLEVSPQAGDGEALTPVAQVSDEEWTIEITPTRKVLTSTAAMTTVVPTADVADVGDPAGEAVGEHPIIECGKAHANPADYEKIYSQIPFNRAEYHGNPTYRHDSTMEILTGHARHQTIVRHGTTTQQHHHPRTGGYSGSTMGRPYFPYGYIRPGLRFNYYRYFPSMRPFWNMSWYGYSGIY